VRLSYKGGYVRFGSKADIEAALADVRFTPKSGHRLSLSECPLCANNGHWHRHFGDRGQKFFTE
jgi:hypothetical protein